MINHSGQPVLMADPDKQRQFVSYSLRFITLILIHCLHSTILLLLPTSPTTCQFSLTGHFCHHWPWSLSLGAIPTAYRVHNTYSAHRIYLPCQIFPYILCGQLTIIYRRFLKHVSCQVYFSPLREFALGAPPLSPSPNDGDTLHAADSTSSSVVHLYNRGPLV